MQHVDQLAAEYDDLTNADGAAHAPSQPAGAQQEQEQQEQQPPLGGVQLELRELKRRRESLDVSERAAQASACGF